MISAKRYKSREEAGVLENLFVFAAVATAIITMGAFSIFVVEAQRYQAGLDLSTHTAIRDIVGSNFSKDPQRLAQSDLSTIFQEMGLTTQNTSVTVADSVSFCAVPSEVDPAFFLRLGEPSPIGVHEALRVFEDGSQHAWPWVG